MDEKEQEEELHSKDVDATGRIELPSEDGDDATNRLKPPSKDEEEEAEENEDLLDLEAGGTPPDDGGTVILGPEAQPKGPPDLPSEKPTELTPGEAAGGDKTMILGGGQIQPKPPGEMDKTMMAQRTFPYIMITSPDQKGRRIDLGDGTFKIGRASDNDLVLQNSMVSTHHAEITVSGHQYAIKDLNSTNGILVNGKVVKSHKLRNGDEVVVGETAFVFEGSMVAGAPTMKKGGLSKKPLLAAVLLVVVVLLGALLLKRGGSDQESGQTKGTTPQPTAAAQAPDRAQEPQPTAIPESSNPLQAAQAAMKQEQWGKAVAFLKKAKKANPEDENIQSLLDKANMEQFIQEHKALGKAHVEEEMWERAAYEFRRVLNVKPDDEEAKALYDEAAQHVARSEGLKEAIALVENKKWQEALARLEDLGGTPGEEGDEINRYLEMARTELNNQKAYEQGLALLKKSQPNEATKALEGVAKDSVYAGDAAQALKRARGMAKGMEFSNQAEKAYAKGQGLEALKFLEQASNELGEASISSLKKRINEVLTSMEQARQKERSKDPKDLSAAYRLYARVIELEKDRSNAYREQAAKQLEALSAPLKKRADEWVEKGDGLADKKELAEAASCYREALNIFPPHEDAKQKLERMSGTLNRLAKKLFQEAYVLEKRGDETGAIEKWREICELVPEGSEYHNKSKAKLEGTQ